MNIQRIANRHLEDVTKLVTKVLWNLKHRIIRMRG